MLRRHRRLGSGRLYRYTSKFFGLNPIATKIAYTILSIPQSFPVICNLKPMQIGRVGWNSTAAKSTLTPRRATRGIVDIGARPTMRHPPSTQHRKTCVQIVTLQNLRIPMRFRIHQGHVRLMRPVIGTRVGRHSSSYASQS